MNACEDQSEPLGESLDIETVVAIGRAAELGLLAGQDLANSVAATAIQSLDADRITIHEFELEPQVVRTLVHTHIAAVVAAIDDHDAHLEDWQSPVVYRCRCPFRGTREEWELHLADRLADALTQAGN